NPQNADYSVAIKSLLQLNQSEQRKRTVQSIIKAEVEFEPRRRQDADFVFIAASPQQARLLRPQLSYHYASDLPVYATSHVFSGNENISADKDINGITYCDVPWILSNDPSMALLKDSLDLQSSSSASRLPRLAALGIDAYQVIPHLQRLAANEFDRFEGTTGKLSIDPQNRIYRELIWAKFKKGQPITIGATPDHSAKLQSH
ncbi:MAG: penicillin-binding protein activator, partial [Pseudomonadota bacterium]